MCDRNSKNAFKLPKERRQWQKNKATPSHQQHVQFFHFFTFKVKIRPN